MSANDFINWMEEMNVTFSQAATLLGLSPRTLKYYTSGGQEIPKPVWLACMRFIEQKHAAVPKSVSPFVGYSMTGSTVEEEVRQALYSVTTSGHYTVLPVGGGHQDIAVTIYG